LSKEIRHRWWILWSITGVCLALDIWTKYLAEKHLSRIEPLSLIGERLELILVFNKGAIFGLDPRHLIPGLPVNLVFTVFMIIAIIFLITYFRFLRKTEILTHWGLAFVLPGAFGNLYDRIVHPAKGVVDFIKMDFDFKPFDPWPIYNFADVWVTVGVSVLILSFIMEELRKKKQPAPAAAPQVPQRGPDEASPPASLPPGNS
jgi:signal peptidase II